MNKTVEEASIEDVTLVEFLEAKENSVHMEVPQNNIQNEATFNVP